MSESTIVSSTIDRSAIERWESEGGRTLAREKQEKETSHLEHERSSARSDARDANRRAPGAS